MTSPQTPTNFFPNSNEQEATMTTNALPCHCEDPELFFAETAQEINVAKALCIDCPVMTECLAGALERREPWGVWGGQLFQHGVVIAQKRPRGRPRKHPVAA